MHKHRARARCTSAEIKTKFTFYSYLLYIYIPHIYHNDAEVASRTIRVAHKYRFGFFSKYFICFPREMYVTLLPSMRDEQFVVSVGKKELGRVLQFFLYGREKNTINWSFTILRQINIFMTHMSNYGNDRLALYTFESVIKFIQCWTNLRLSSAPPLQLGERYFQLYPEETDPVWGVRIAHVIQLNRINNFRVNKLFHFIFSFYIYRSYSKMWLLL